MIADRQVPRPGEVFLDHVGWFVRDMAAAGQMFERLGFVLTAYREHRNTIPGGGTEPAGTANRCAMLERGYLEILTAVPGCETPLAAQLLSAIERYQGVHLIAFAGGDAERERARLAEAGFDPRPVVNLSRPVKLAGGSDGFAAFAVVRTPPESMPEGRIQFLEHKTPDLVWQPDLIARGNAIEALTGILVVAVDVAEAAARYARFTGHKAHPTPDGGASIILERGRIAFAGPGRPATHRRAAYLAPPFIAAVALRSHDLTITRSYLAGRGIQFQTDAADYLVVSPDYTAGTEIVIHAKGADDCLNFR